MQPWVLLVRYASRLDSKWVLGGVTLQMAYTSGEQDQITTKTWVDCNPSLRETPISFFGADIMTADVGVCETAGAASGSFMWRLWVATSDESEFDGTTLPIEASWR